MPQPDPAPQAEVNAAKPVVHTEPGPDHPEIGGQVVACTCHPGRRSRP